MQVIRLKELKRKIGLSTPTIYARMNPNSGKKYDPSFPKPIRLGQGAKAVGWIESEVDEWVQSRVPARGDAA